MVQKLQQFSWKVGFCLLVKVNREGPAPTACAAGLFSFGLIGLNEDFFLHLGLNMVAEGVKVQRCIIQMYFMLVIFLLNIINIKFTIIIELTFRLKLGNIWLLRYMNKSSNFASGKCAYISVYQSTQKSFRTYFLSPKWQQCCV